MATKPSKRNDWQFGCDKVIIKDKKRLIDYFIRLFFNRTLAMFEYTGLPEELPQRQIELIVQSYRLVVFPEDLIDGKHYVMWGGTGYLPDGYYEPTKAILVNPYLKYNEILDIKKEWHENGKCVVMYNDSMHNGLLNTHELYASLLAENIISLRYGTINARIPSLVSADNDNTKESADAFFKKIEDGEEYGIISGSPFFDNLKTSDYGKGSDSTHLKELIEEQQYLKSSWWNDLGINANFNMKRESINESEASMGELALLPLCDDMLRERKRAIKLINKMWGTNISVRFSSSWMQLRKNIKIEQKVQQSQIQVTPKEEPVENKPEEKVDDNNENGKTD